jgi:hypothetical protein
MEKKAQVTIPAQRHFSIGNWSFLELTVSPTLYARDRDNEPFAYREINKLSSSGGRYSTDVRTNDHGQRYSYATASHELLFKSASAEYRFNANKFGNQVTYSTSSPGASVEAFYWIFDDFLRVIELTMRKLDDPVDHKIDESNREYEVQLNGQIIQCSTGDPVHPAPKKKVSQIVIADTDRFSFLSNVNLYFSGCDVYQEYPPEKIKKVDRHGEGNPSAATDYYLTPDKGYPPGITILTIKDGFSEATAVVEFEHDTFNKQVTVTIKSFTSRLCDIRDFSYLEQYFPNAICIAL